MPLSSRGQMGLDLLLAMVVLLVVLTAFSGVLARFESSHAEIGVRQQLRENVLLSTTLLGSSMNHFRLLGNYPDTHTLSFGTGLPSKVRKYTHFTGTVPLLPVKAVGTPQGFECASTFDFGDTNTVIFRVSGADLGTSADVEARGTFPYRAGFTSYHSVLLDGCFTPIAIGAV